MSAAEKITLVTIALSFPLILPALLAQFAAGRFTEGRRKTGFIVRVAVVSYSLAVAVAFFISTILRTFAPSIVTGREAVAPVFNFLSANEQLISLSIVVIGAIAASAFLFPGGIEET